MTHSGVSKRSTSKGRYRKIFRTLRWVDELEPVDILTLRDLAERERGSAVHLY